MITRLKRSHTMRDRTIKRGMLAKSLITHYKKGRIEHYTLVDLLSTVKYIIKVPKTKKCSVLGSVFFWLGRIVEFSGGGDVIARKRSDSRLLI